MCPACRWFGDGAPEGLHAMASPAVLELAALAWSQAHGSNQAVDQAAAGPVHVASEIKCVGAVNRRWLLITPLQRVGPSVLCPSVLQWD